MFDLGLDELLLIVIVAVIVIGPKDLPMALRTAGRWMGRMRKISGQFRAGLDAMIREAEMQELEAKWKAQNEKIMREHPNGGPPEMEQTGAYPAAPIEPAPPESAPDEPQLPLGSAESRAIVVDNPDEYSAAPAAGDKRPE